MKPVSEELAAQLRVTPISKLLAEHLRAYMQTPTTLTLIEAQTLVARWREKSGDLLRAYDADPYSMYRSYPFGSLHSYPLTHIDGSPTTFTPRFVGMPPELGMGYGQEASRRQRAGLQTPVTVVNVHDVTRGMEGARINAEIARTVREMTQKDMLEERRYTVLDKRATLARIIRELNKVKPGFLDATLVNIRNKITLNSTDKIVRVIRDMRRTIRQLREQIGELQTKHDTAEAAVSRMKTDGKSIAWGSVWKNRSSGKNSAVVHMYSEGTLLRMCSEKGTAFDISAEMLLKNYTLVPFEHMAYERLWRKFVRELPVSSPVFGRASFLEAYFAGKVFNPMSMTEEPGNKVTIVGYFSDMPPVTPGNAPIPPSPSHYHRGGIVPPAPPPPRAQPRCGGDPDCRDPDCRH